MISTLSVHGQDSFEKALFKRGSDELKYRIMMPESFDKNKKYPVVLFLHGAGERGEDNEKQLVHGAKLFEQNRQKHPSIVIFPQCPSNSSWSNVSVEYDQEGGRIFNFNKQLPTNKPLELVAQLMDSVINLSHVDSKRCYVGGLSMGGMGTYELLSIRPKMFVAAIAICGGGNTNLVNRYAKYVSLWVFHGDKDNVVPARHSKEMVTAIEKLGYKPRFNLYPDVNHNSWDNAFAEPELLSWLYSHYSKH